MQALGSSYEDILGLQALNATRPVSVGALIRIESMSALKKGTEVLNTDVWPCCLATALFGLRNPTSHVFRS